MEIERISRWVLCLCLIAFAIGGCATSGDEDDIDRAPASSDEGNAHPLDYINRSFFIQAPRTVREKKSQAMPFFYKSCAPNGKRDFYSKLEYFCNER